MIAKIWNYSGWINNPDINSIKQGFKGVFNDINETIAGMTELASKNATKLCLVTERLTITVITCPDDGCAFINVASADDGRIYDLLSVLPDYFDILINDADNSIYPAQKTALMQESEAEEQESEQSNVVFDLDVLKADQVEKVKVKVSGKWMLHKFKCTEDYIKNVCHGSCCTGTDKVLISLLPEEAKRQVEMGFVVKDNKLCPDKKTGKCPHLNECGLCDIHFTPDKPFGCIASPFTLNKADTLVIRQRYSRMKCHGEGEYAYKTFRASLDLILGKEEAQRICDYYDQGNTGDVQTEISLETYKKLVYLDGLKHQQGKEESTILIKHYAEGNAEPIAERTESEEPEN